MMVRPLRILQVSAYSLAEHGGVQSHVRDLSQALRLRGHDVRIVAPGAGPGDSAVAVLGRCKRLRLAGTAFEVTAVGASDLKSFAAMMRKWAPDIIHVHGIWVPFLPLHVLRSVEAARVATFHDTTAPGLTGSLMRQSFRLLSSFILDRLDAAIAVSDLPLANLRAATLGPVPIIIPPVTNLAPFLQLPPPVLPKQAHVLHWGRLEPRKNIGVLLEAIKSLTERKDRLPGGMTLPRFTIAGSGPQADDVSRLSHRLGNHILRHIPAPNAAQLRELLADAHVSVSPASYGESFGIVLTESLASGRPVIAAANPGYKAVMTGPGEELLFPPESPQALVEKLTTILGGAEDFARLSAWGRRHAAQYDVSAWGERFENIYREAITRRQRSNREATGNQA